MDFQISMWDGGYQGVVLHEHVYGGYSRLLLKVAYVYFIYFLYFYA